LSNGHKGILIAEGAEGAEKIPVSRRESPHIRDELQFSGG
jgi:hypothetical protein